MVGVRLPMTAVRKIDKIATALSCDRSRAIRWLLHHGLDGGLATVLLRSDKGRGLAGEIARSVVDDFKAKAAAAAAKRARPSDKVQAEINALRAEERAAERKARIADRLRARPR
jgi:hypothetical protein